MQWTFVWEWFPQVFFQRHISLVELPPSSFPHFGNSVAFLHDILFPPLMHSHFWIRVECHLQLEQVLSLGKNSKDKNHTLPQKLFYNVHKSHLHCNNPSFSEFLLCKRSQIYNLVSFCASVEVRHDQCFKTSRFALTRLDSLKICFKLVSRVQSGSFWLAHWVRVELANI